MMICVTTFTRIILLLFSLVIVLFVDRSGQIVTSDLVEGLRVIYPEFVNIGLRSKRDSTIKNGQENAGKAIKLGDWLVELSEDTNMVIPKEFVAEWIMSDDTTSYGALEDCSFNRGVILGSREESTAALTVCGKEVIGMVYSGGIPYFVEPLNESTGEHLMYQSKEFHRHQLKRSVSQTLKNTANEQWIYNLTGDTIDIGNNDLEADVEIKFDGNMENVTDAIVTGGNNTANSNTSDDFFTFLSNQEDWHQEQIDLGEEDNGYFYDSTWSATVMQVQKSSGSILPARWLEIAVAVDYTLINFHGKGKVERYVLSLMNIVSAIYQDPSLNANIKLVITRMIMYQHKKHSVIRQGNARKSLENVNTWNRKLHAILPTGKSSHDIALWLTKSDIGGPSGYAPVSGVCDPKRSCALTRDEGLTSAFIIAHETAHILGLSHDGDKKNNNDCSQEALDGSIMAPMVSATFNKFAWSSCSKKELQRKLNKWTCLLNAPTDPGDIILNATLQTTFTMDEQCRMEFGDGYSMCRSFEIVEPCSHLWCGHKDSPLVCKTKKGPPLEGTECDFGKWCVNGYCQQVGQTRIGRVPVVFNSLDGGWSEWGPWGTCSKSCGTGIQFRSRKCNNPEPSHGGNFCSGDSEEWQICFSEDCPEPYVDLRDQQCKQLPRLLNMDYIAQNSSWGPYESDFNNKKCKLICINEDKRELYSTNENLMDGTPCSYDNEDNVCVQGKCHVVDCSHKLHSDIQRDRCGVCQGDNSTCAEKKSQVKKKLRREVTRVALLPRMAKQIKVEVKASSDGTIQPVLAFILKNRRRKKYVITIPNTSVHTKIMEGTKFSYKKFNDRHVIWASGPLHAETVILVVASKNDIEYGITLKSKTTYTIQKTYLIPSKRFVWILGGWGPCSVSCGGGRRQKTAACWDNLEGKIVKRKQCSLLQKPKIESEKCNTFGCNFQWIPGKWEPCSASCGHHGLQSREMYCIPESLLDRIYDRNGTISVNPWLYMVNPNKCSAAKPITTQTCNRVPCFSYWITGNWSTCSSSCGQGIQIRPVYCPRPGNEDFFTCGDRYPPSQRQCLGDRKQISCRTFQKECKNDRSEFCSFESLHKYCILKNFRTLCCKSCRNSYSHIGMYSSF